MWTWLMFYHRRLSFGKIEEVNCTVLNRLTNYLIWAIWDRKMSLEFSYDLWPSETNTWTLHVHNMNFSITDIFVKSKTVKLLFGVNT